MMSVHVSGGLAVALLEVLAPAGVGVVREARVDRHGAVRARLPPHTTSNSHVRQRPCSVFVVEGVCDRWCQHHTLTVAHPGKKAVLPFQWPQVSSRLAPRRAGVSSDEKTARGRAARTREKTRMVLLVVLGWVPV